MENKKSISILLLSTLVVSSILSTRLIQAQTNYTGSLSGIVRSIAKLLIKQTKSPPPQLTEKMTASVQSRKLTKEILARSTVKLSTLSKSTEKNTTTSSKPQESEGYIIQLKDDPIILFQKQYENLTEPKIQQKIEDYKFGLRQTHNYIKSTIKSLVPEAKMVREYRNLFNGLAVTNISERETLQLKKRLPAIKDIFPNYKVQAFLNGSIPLINADDVWRLGYTGKEMKIAIIDTGIDKTQADLDEGKVIQEDCYCLGDCCPNALNEQHGEGAAKDDQGHGTHVAGIAASDGDASEGNLKGVAPDANLVAIKVLNSAGWGYNSDVIAGIEKAVDSGVDVMNLSLGGPGTPDDPISTTINNAVGAGVVVVVAAGNSGPNYQTIQSPGCAEEAITVGASDKNDLIANFSSRGPNINFTIKPDVLAPGVDICSSRWDSAWPSNQCFDDTHISLSGTSMAAPHVAGAVVKYPFC